MHFPIRRFIEDIHLESMVGWCAGGWDAIWLVAAVVAVVGEGEGEGLWVA
jgi:hypothetical protein